MNPLEITLIVIGIITIIASFLMVDNESKKTDKSGSPDKSETDLNDESRKRISEKMEAILSNISEEIIVRTDDALDKLSNEKIMAVNDFSEQILEKIRKNHEEVVFLYSMLEDKEKELKDAVKEIDLSKKKLQSIFELKSKNYNENTPAQAQTNQSDRQTKVQNKQVNSNKKVKSNEKDSQTTEQTNAVTNVPADALSTDSSEKKIDNQRILELYSKGKSVLEISRMLELGQGEVKLVINLFNEKK